jgi:hypothetical protein
MEVSVSKQRRLLQWVAANLLPKDVTLRTKVKQRYIRILWRGKERDVPRLNADHFAVYRVPNLSIFSGTKIWHYLMFPQSWEEAFRSLSTLLYAMNLLSWTGNFLRCFFLLKIDLIAKGSCYKVVDTRFSLISINFNENFAFLKDTVEIFLMELITLKSSKCFIEFLVH